jgi:D-3-phosphoglycerate dehydrogenase
MKVLIADLFSPVAIMEMQGAGMEVTFNKDLKEDSLKEALATMQPEVLVVRSTKVTADHINANPKLQLVVRAGAGTDTIDVAHCARNGIYVANCPAKNANAVSELTVGLMVMIDRQMASGNQMLHEGKWNKSMFAKCKGLKGRTVGFIGFGAIAQLVCRTVKAMDMNVLVCTRTHKAGEEEKHGMRYVSQEELLKEADIVSMHCPNTP